jgi:polyisoprenoid-binding protein YceI
MSATVLTPERIASGSYTIDGAHSNVGFEVRHMGIATVRGKFRTFQGTIDATGEIPVLDGTVEVSSIDTGEENRDGHLQAPDFFDVAQYPQISFHSVSIDAGADDTVTLRGNLTIKGITKSIELSGTVAENGPDPWGNERVGFEVSGVIDRRDYDLKWNQTLPNGNLLVANEVKLVVSVSAVKAS